MLDVYYKITRREGFTVTLPGSTEPPGRCVEAAPLAGNARPGHGVRKAHTGSPSTNPISADFTELEESVSVASAAAIGIKFQCEQHK